MNGISSHVEDYDDTTPKNYSHTSSPVASALLAYASANRVRGRDFVEAFILGFEAESRVGNVVYPAHYDVGWHMTGTIGVFGAAAAIGKLIGLNEQQMVWALGLAATQAAGLREMFGSMGKAFHPGRSAQNGYAAALLAQAGFTSGERGIEGPRGFAAVLAATAICRRSPTRLGVDFDLRENTYKPFPCGIVNHPTIDGGIQIHNEHRPDPARSLPSGCGWRRWCSTCATSRTSRRGSRASSPCITARRSDWCAARRPARIHRRSGERSRDQACARVDDGDRRSVRHRGSGARGGRAERRPPALEVRRAIAGQHPSSADGQAARREVPRSGQSSSCRRARSSRSSSCAGRSTNWTMSASW